MSIHDLLYKIKREGKILDNTLIYTFLIAIVGFGSFLLGRLSVETEPRSEVKSDLIENKSIPSLSQNKAKSQSTVSFAVEGKYVASKNGKLYYTASCKASNRIKPENRVWFDNESDAKKSGYSRSQSCK